MEEDNINNIKGVDNDKVDEYPSIYSAPITTENTFNSINGIPQFPGSTFHQKKIVKLENVDVFLDDSYPWYVDTGYRVIMEYNKFIESTSVLQANMVSGDASVTGGKIRFSNTTFNIQRLPMNLYDLKATKISDETAAVLNIPETMAVCNITCYICAAPDNWRYYLNSAELFGSYFRASMNTVCQKAEVRILKQVNLSTCESTPLVKLEDFDLPYNWDIVIFYSYDVHEKFFEDIQSEGYYLNREKLFCPVSVEMLTSLFIYNPIN